MRTNDHILLHRKMEILMMKMMMEVSLLNLSVFVERKEFVEMETAGMHPPISTQRVSISKHQQTRKRF